LKGGEERRGEEILAGVTLCFEELANFQNCRMFDSGSDNMVASLAVGICKSLGS
jgi:hypothetical protein